MARSRAQPKGRAKATKRKRAPKSTRGAKKSKKPRRAVDGRVLQHPKEWFHQHVAEGLWAPRDVRDAAEVPPAFAPLQHSWWRVANALDEHHDDWAPVLNGFTVEPLPPYRKKIRRPSADQPPPPALPAITSCIQIKLLPTPDQRGKLDQMFATRRAVYNKLVAASKHECANKLARKATTVNMLAAGYRAISAKATMSGFFRNKRVVRRHLACNSKVFGGAFDDFKAALNSSVKLFEATKEKGKRTTFPELKFKSRFARSDSMDLRTDRMRVKVNRMGVGFDTTYMGKKLIKLAEPLPPLTYGTRLRRTREGIYYLCVPRHVGHAPTASQRTCALDPGVRKFITLYDPSGRVCSVTDSNRVLLTRMHQIDRLRSKLATLEAAVIPSRCSPTGRCACAHACSKCAKKKKCTCQWRCKTPTRASKHMAREEHVASATTLKLKRQRYRLRRRIRFLYRKVTRLVDNMHQVLSKWLSQNYHEVLLPTFQTQQMAARYIREEQLDITPDQLLEPVEEVVLRGRKRKLRRCTVRAMMALSHYRFRMMLTKKMQRTGGRLVEVTEEYTSKTCSGCGHVDDALGGSEVYRCRRCGLVQDRDANAARNILHKNVEMSVLQRHFAGVPASGRPARA